MWILTTKGFFSVVQKKTWASGLTIRARAKGDLDRLVEEIGNGLKVESSPNNDYPYRVECPHDLFAQYLDAEVRNIDYDNFKSAVEDRMGGLRAKIYMKIWSVLHDIEGARRSA